MGWKPMLRECLEAGRLPGFFVGWIGGFCGGLGVFVCVVTWGDRRWGFSGAQRGAQGGLYRLPPVR